MRFQPGDKVRFLDEGTLYRGFIDKAHLLESNGSLNWHTYTAPGPTSMCFCVADKDVFPDQNGLDRVLEGL